jgi:multisubunit Na+/H+ antiporter MnhC subunit
MGNRTATPDSTRPAAASGPVVAPRRASALQRSLFVTALLVELAWIGFLLVLVLRR